MVANFVQPKYFIDKLSHLHFFSPKFLVEEIKNLRFVAAVNITRNVTIRHLVKLGKNRHGSLKEQLSHQKNQI